MDCKTYNKAGNTKNGDQNVENNIKRESKQRVHSLTRHSRPLLHRAELRIKYRREYERMSVDHSKCNMTRIPQHRTYMTSSVTTHFDC